MGSRLALCVMGVLGALSGEGSASAAPTNRMLVEAADVSNVILSPDGGSVAFRVERGSVEADSYASTWWVQDVDGSMPAWELGDGGEPLRRYGLSQGEKARWSPDSRVLYFRALHGGEMQVWRAGMDGEGAEQVTHDDANVRGFLPLADGGLIYEIGATRADVAAAEQAENDAGVRIDVSVPIGAPLFRGVYSEGRFASQRYAGEWMDLTDLLADAPAALRVIDDGIDGVRNATEAERAAFTAETAPPEPRFVDGAVAESFRVRGERVVYLTPYGDEQTLRVAAHGTDDMECPDALCRDIVWYDWSADGQAVIFALRDRPHGGAHKLLRWDLAGDAVELIVDMEGVANGGRNNPCALGEGFAICVTASTDTPPRVDRIDLDSGARRVLHDPNAALAAAAGPRAELLVWRDGEGRQFTGQYYPAAPRGDGAPPLFITYYVCAGYLRGGAGDEWPLAAMAEAGIAVLCITYPNQEGNYPEGEATAVADYRIAVGGIEAALELLEARGVDVRRVGMGGYSFGAEVAFWVAMHTDLLDVMSVASPTLSRDYWLQRALMGEAFDEPLSTAWGLGAPEATPDQWALLDPALNLDRLGFPMLMQVPEQEYLTAVELFVPLLRTQAPTEVYAFPGEPHLKFRPRHKLAIYERNLDWFRFWLLGEEDPDVDKTDQYARWRVMQERLQAAGSGR